MPNGKVGKVHALREPTEREVKMERLARKDLFDIPAVCLHNDRKFYMSERFANFFNLVPSRYRSYFLPEVIERRKERHRNDGLESDEFGVVLAGDLELTDQDRIEAAMPMLNTRRAKTVFGESLTANDIRAFARKSFQFAMEGNDKYAKLVWETALGRPEETLEVTHTVSISDKLREAAEQRRLLAQQEIHAEFTVVEDERTSEEQSATTELS